MKILYLVTSAELGGAQKSVLLLAENFRGGIAAGTENQELFDEAQKLGIPAYQLNHLKRHIEPWHDILALFEIYRLVKRVNPDILHANSSKAGFLGSIAGWLAGAKVVYSARGFVFNEPHSWPVKRVLIALEKFASLFRDQIITVSAVDEALASKYRIISPSKLTTIHNAIPPIELSTKIDARKKLQLPDDRLIVGTIANFYRTKGLDILIQAVQLLDHQVKRNCLFVIIGSGPLEAQLKTAAQKSGLISRIMFAGQMPNAAEYLKAFDIFVLPSRKEGFPLVLLEALQAELPIIATNVGGNAELLGNAGKIVPPGDPKALSDALVALVNDSTQRSRLAESAKARAREFTPEKLFAEMSREYSKLA